MVGLESAAITKVAVVTNAAVTCAVLPVITIAFDTVTTPAVLPPILDNTVAAILAFAASFNDIVIISVADVVNTSTFEALFAANVAVTTPAFAAIAFNSATVGLPDIVGFDDVATTRVPAVTNAAVTSAGEPVIIIAFDASTVPVVFPPIVDNIVATRLVSFTSSIIISTSLSFATTLSKFAYVSAVKFVDESDIPAAE